MKIATYVSGALLYGTAIALPASAVSAQTVTVEAPSKEEKVVCRRDQAVGTRLARRVCLTKAQWKARERAQEDYKSRLLDDSRTNQASTFRLSPSAAAKLSPAIVRRSNLTATA